MHFMPAQSSNQFGSLQNVGQNADFGAGALDLLDSKKQGDTLTDVLGLQRKASDSDDDSDDDEPAEEGEVEEI